MGSKQMTFEERHRTLKFVSGLPLAGQTDLVSKQRELDRSWRMDQLDGGPMVGPVLAQQYHAYTFRPVFDFETSGRKPRDVLARAIVGRSWSTQKFAPAATPWELMRSVLAAEVFSLAGAPIPSGKGRFTPVVQDTGDGDALVVGHMGTVNGDRLLVSRNAKLVDKVVHQMMARGTKVFVAADEYQSEAPDGWRKAGFSSQDYTVYTTPDGQVLRVLHINDGDALIDANWVIDDVIAPAVAPVMLKLAYRGARMCSSLVGRLRNGQLARTFLGGATRELAESAAAEVAGNTVREVGLDAAMAARGLKFAGYEVRTGVPRAHFEKMVAAARETNQVAVLRANKEAAIPLIEKGAVGKPKELSIPGFKSSPRTGVLTASTPEQVQLVQTNGYYLLEVAPGKPPVMRLGSEVKPLPRNPYWQVENGQVLHKTGHPVVGDYDGLGSLSLESPGRLVVGVPKGPVKGDWLGPDWQRFMNAVNSKLDRFRVLHGAQEAFPDLANAGKYGGLTDELAYAVFPDGRAIYLNGKAEQAAFYEAFGRPTIIGSHPRPGPGTKVVDQLAPLRKPK
jgi:hypothetical protein